MKCPGVSAAITALGTASGAALITASATASFAGAGCAADRPQVAGGVSLVLELPKGLLDPKGFSALDVILHEPTKDVTLTTTIGDDGTFDLGPIDPSTTVSIEVALRNASSAVVGYGRTAAAAELSKGAEIVVPVRRPIVYIAGTVARDADDNDETTPLHWTEAPATFYDLSIGANLDGKTQVGTTQAVLMIAAGASLFMVTQSTSDPDGALTGPAKVLPVAAADHAVGAALAGSMTGAVLDGAGSDDGTALVIGTRTQLFMIDTATGVVGSLADGSFARVAIVTTETGDIAAVAIKNRGATTAACSTQAELWWATLTGDGASPAQLVATGGFSDVASDRGAAYYIDACKGELGSVSASAVTAIRPIASATMGSRATALAVSNGQAYVGIETAPTMISPATTSLLVMSTVATTEEPRMLWTEVAQQVVEASDFSGVQRQLDAKAAIVEHLETGAGGRYVALTTSAQFDGDAVLEANFPRMNIETDELRVFDAATGGIVQRYRSWCSGELFVRPGIDIGNWGCASTTGQMAAAGTFDHHINSMTFLFGKK